MKSLAIVIVNYRTAELTEACVASLDGRLPLDSIAAKIFVVENDSADGSYETLSRVFKDRPDVELLQANQNDGYGAGNNLILASIVASDEFDFVWLLNPDTVLRTEIPEQVRSLLARPRTAAVGARLEDPDTSAQVSAFRFPGFFSEFLQAANLSLLNRLFGRWRVVQPIPEVPSRADWLAGASVFFKVAALKDVGVFDETFFLYFEEVDLFRRLAEAGWESWYVPEMRLIHHVGASTGISDSRRRPSEMPDYWYASRSHYFRKQHGTIGAVWVDLCWLAGRCIYLLSRSFLRKTDSSAVKARRIVAFNPLIRTRRTAPQDWLNMADDDETWPLQISTRHELWNRIRLSWRSHGNDFSRPGFKAVAVHGFGQWRMSVRPKWVRAPLGILYRILYRRCCAYYGIELPYSVRLGERVVFEHQGGIVIHGNCVIGDDSIIRHGVTLGNRYLDRPSEAPVLGERVNVGAGAVILGQIALGDDVQVGANAVVLEDVPAGATVTGPKSRIRECASPSRIPRFDADAAR